MNEAECPDCPLLRVVMATHKLAVGSIITEQMAVTTLGPKARWRQEIEAAAKAGIVETLAFRSVKVLRVP